jgi:hypothetical protein
MTTTVGSMPLEWTHGNPFSTVIRVVDGVNTVDDGTGNFKAQIRRSQSLTATLIGEFDVEVDTDTTPPDTDDLLITLSITEEDSEAIGPGTYSFDIKVEGGITIGPGTVTVNPGVTSF